MEPALNERYARLAERAPGFGGLALGDANEIIVYLTEAGQLEAAGPVINEYLDANPVDDVRREVARTLRVQRVRHDYGQLYRWDAALASVIFAQPGILMTDIDEGKNRLYIGVADEATLTRVRGAVTALRLPAEAVYVEVTSPNEPSQTLRDDVQPTRGGMGISQGFSIPSGQLQDCTLGFNAWWLNPTPALRVFVTNSHCGQPNYTDYLLVYQGGRYVGTEIADVALPAEKRRLAHTERAADLRDLRAGMGAADRVDHVCIHS